MENNILVTCVMYYSLFHKKLIHNESKLFKSFPKNVFGVFSTVRRYSKIKSHPIDIHGCIGYWDNNFNSLSEKNIYNNLLRVSHDAVWTDSRNKYFPPIEKDPQSLLEIDFMLNPIYKINKATGIIENLNAPFSNITFGIIIETADKTQRATYLPNVFPNISWNKLVESIKNKANITSQDFNLYAYKIVQIKSSFITFLTGEIFNYISIYKFSRFLLDNMKPRLVFPFAHTYKNNTLKWSSDDDVRNISTLSEVYRYANLYAGIASKSEQETIKQKIVDVVTNMDRYSSQSLSFLGYIFPLLKINSTRFCKKLLQDLPSADEEFAKPEIIIGMNHAGCITNIKDMTLTFDQNDSIFKMNWVIQAIVSFDRKPPHRLVVMLEDKVNELISNKQDTETNYIAVAFEALCFVYKSAPMPKTVLLSKMFELFFELEKRKTDNNVFYTFLDKIARVDISGHINNGFAELAR